MGERGRGAPGFRGTGLPASEDSRSPKLPGSWGSPPPKTPELRGSLFPSTPDPQRFPLPRTPNHLGSRFVRTLDLGAPPFRIHLPGTPRGCPLFPSTPSPRGSCCPRDPRRTAAPRLLSPCSRQDAEPPPLPPPFPPRAAAGAARAVAEPCPAVPARAALPALPAGAPGPPRLRYGRGWHPRGRGHTASPPTHVSTPRRFLAELGGVRGLHLTFQELGSNRAGWLQVWQRRRVSGSSAVSLRWGWSGVPRPGPRTDPPAPRSGRCSSTASRQRAGGKSSCPFAPSQIGAWP